MLGIIGPAKFLGRLSHEELLPVLEWAYLAILPSRAESFGLAIAEAQAAGRERVANRFTWRATAEAMARGLLEPADPPIAA